jgi:hypothetical protein
MRSTAIRHTPALVPLQRTVSISRDFTPVGKRDFSRSWPCLSNNMAPPKLETVLTSLEGAIAVIKYNRPNNANALGPQTMGDLLEALRWAEAESQARAVVLTGVGKFFSAGME